MSSDSCAPAWQVLGASVRGASHLHSGQPNQDAIAWAPPEGHGPPIALAVADGHGSAKCFRSHLGAQFAVGAATETVAEQLTPPNGPSDLASIAATAQELVLRWQAGVAAHLSSEPFSEEELQRLEEKEGIRARAAVEAHPLLAYGATILVTLLTDTFVLYLQLGDGDIFTVSEEGQVRRPLAGDARLFADQTTSLCAADPLRDFRVGFELFDRDASGGDESAPALVLLSTDGYANSFRDEAGFLQVGADLFELLRNEGIAPVRDNLESWLNEASRCGSGDDVTVGLLCRTSAIEPAQMQPLQRSVLPERECAEVPA